MMFDPVIQQMLLKALQEDLISGFLVQDPQLPNKFDFKKNLNFTPEQMGNLASRFMEKRRAHIPECKFTKREPYLVFDRENYTLLDASTCFLERPIEPKAIFLIS